MVRYRSRVTVTVDQMEPLREICTRGSVQGIRWGCTHTCTTHIVNSHVGLSKILGKTLFITFLHLKVRYYSSLTGSVTELCYNKPVWKYVTTQQGILA